MQMKQVKPQNSSGKSNFMGGRFWERYYFLASKKKHSSGIRMDRMR
jgi:hypothetical protein